MADKRITIGTAEWGLDDKDVDLVLAQVKGALENGVLAELPLLDGAGRPVTVYLNGRLTPVVVVDLDGDGRPSEIC